MAALAMRVELDGPADRARCGMLDLEAEPSLVERFEAPPGSMPWHAGRVTYRLTFPWDSLPITPNMARRIAITGMPDPESGSISVTYDAAKGWHLLPEMAPMSTVVELTFRATQDPLDRMVTPTTPPA